MNPSSGGLVEARRDYFREEARRLALPLLEYIKVLRNQVSTSSRKYPFFFYFNWRRLTEKEFYSLILGMMYLGTNYRILQEQDELTRFIYGEISSILHQNAQRFANTKFSKLFVFQVLKLGYFPPDGTQYPPVREWKGNYFMDITSWLERNFTLRFETPRKVKRQEFIRGYRDKGSKASVSEVARRQANEAAPDRNDPLYILSWQAQLERWNSQLNNEETLRE